MDYDGRALAAQNNWWGQASGPDTDTPDVGIAPQIYYGAPINDGLVGHWAFDTEWTTNTTVYDRSGQGNDGTLNGGLSLADQVAGQNGEALDFDGVNDQVDVAIAPLALAELTIVNFSNLRNQNSAHNSIITTDDFRYQFGVYNPPGDTNPEQRIDQIGSASSAGGGQINFDQWYQTSMVYNGANISLLLDAAANGSTASVGVSNINSLRFGRDGLSGIGAADPYAGSLDDIRIYSRALDPSEISELHRMNTTSSVSTSGFLSSAP